MCKHPWANSVTQWKLTTFRGCCHLSTLQHRYLHLAKYTFPILWTVTIQCIRTMHVGTFVFTNIFSTIRPNLLAISFLAAVFPSAFEITCFFSSLTCVLLSILPNHCSMSLPLVFKPLTFIYRTINPFVIRNTSNSLYQVNLPYPCLRSFFQSPMYVPFSSGYTKEPHPSFVWRNWT